MDAACNAVLYSYGACMELFYNISKSPTREELERLEKAYDSVEESLKAITKLFEDRGIPLEHSWALNKWIYEDYEHPDGRYGCPADMLDDVYGFIRTWKK